MASPTNEEISHFIGYIVKTATRDEKGLKEDVIELCEKVLLPLCKVLNGGVENKQFVTERLEFLRKRFTDIYWTLRLHLHLVFYHDLEKANEVKELQELGHLLRLPENDLTKKQPDADKAVDPGSKLLDIVSTCIG